MRHEMDVHDPLHSLREACKQALLLEDHLFHPSKQCQDCISKHLMAMEALVEEAITLDVTGRLRGFLEGSLWRIVVWQVVWGTGRADAPHLAQAIRGWRKGLTVKLVMPRLMHRLMRQMRARSEHGN